MSRLLGIALVLACLVGPAAAVPPVARLQVWRQGGAISLRLSLVNPEPNWKGPVSLGVYVRPLGLGPWIPVRLWPREHAIGPHHTISRDLFGASNPALRLFSSLGPIKIKGVVRAPGLKGVAEYSEF